MSWLTVPLSQLLETSDSGVWGDEDMQCGISVLRSTNMSNDGTLDFSNLTFRDIPQAKRITKLLRPGDIILENSGGGPKQPVGRVCFFEGHDVEHVVGNFCRRLRAFSDVINPKFLFWRLNYGHAIGETLRYQTQTTGLRNLQFRAYVEQPINLPALSEQARIVELLDEVDRLRKLRREADAKASRVLPALFLKIFGDPATNPMGWPVEPLANFVGPVNRRNPVVSPDKPFVYVDIAGIDGEQGIIRSTKKVLGREAPSRARQVINWRDTLVSTVRPYLRATALVPKELDGEIASTGFCVLRPTRDHGFAWLYQITRQTWFTEQLNLRARGASYPAVTDADIMQLPIPIPSDEARLRQFDGEYENFLKTLNLARSGSEKISYLFDLLLQRAFSGQLTVKWREAHMKELLTEMKQQARILDLPLPKELEVTT